MKATNVLLLSPETVKEAIHQYLTKTVFHGDVQFEITDVTIEAGYPPAFKVTVVEIVPASMEVHK